MKHSPFGMSNITNLGGTIVFTKNSKTKIVSETMIFNGKGSPRLVRNYSKRIKNHADWSEKITKNHQVKDKESKRLTMDFAPPKELKQEKRMSFYKEESNKDFNSNLKSPSSSIHDNRDSRAADLGAKNYMKRTFSSSVKDKKNVVHKEKQRADSKRANSKRADSKRASSRYINSDKSLTSCQSKNIKIGINSKTRNFDEHPLMYTSSKAKMGNTTNMSSTREKKNGKMIRQNLHMKPNSDYYQKTASKRKLDILNFSYGWDLARRNNGDSGERQNSIDKSSVQKSVSKNRESFRQSTMEFKNETEESQFKAKVIPKSHKMLPVVFHSTKELTSFKEFNFHRRPHHNDEIEEGNEEDSEGQVSNSLVYCYPQLMDDPLKPNAFNYNQKCELNSPESSEMGANTSSLGDKKPVKYSIRQLVNKARGQAKKCENFSCRELEQGEYIKSNNVAYSLEFECFEKEVENMTDSDFAKLQIPEISESPEIRLKKMEDKNTESIGSISNFWNEVNTSIGTLLTSSFASNNLQTITVSSMDSYELNIPKTKNIFDGDLSIDAIINQYIEPEEKEM
jgi:hypothetical protein